MTEKPVIVTVISTGPGDPDLLNSITLRTLREASLLILRTGRHGLSAWLEKEHPAYRTLDELYEKAENFDELTASIAQEIWLSAKEVSSVTYAVPDALTDRSVKALFAAKPENGMIRIVPGFSYADFYLSSCTGLLPSSNFYICPACDFSFGSVDPTLTLLITELNDAITAGIIKTTLSQLADDEQTVFFFDAEGKPNAIPLYELDRQDYYDHLSAVIVPGTDMLHRKQKTLKDLMEIMDILRSPEGCPWDRVQTHESLKPYLVEEAWEVVDSIEKNNPDHLAEELGDLLFQVVFHTSIGTSFDEFNMTDVITCISNKMIRRHPHVFGTSEKPSAEFSEAAWDKIKQKEQGTESIADTLEAVSEALPSLRYAEKVIRKLRNAVPNPDASADSLLNALKENTEKIGQADESNREHYLGRILFLCAELSQFYSLDSEVILHETVKRAIETCRSLEEAGKNDSISPGTLDF